MTAGAETEKINAERPNRSKSMFVWFGNKSNRIKLEIGSSVRSNPYSKKRLKINIQEFLEEHDGTDDIEKYGLHEITLNVLNIDEQQNFDAAINAFSGISDILKNIDE